MNIADFVYENARKFPNKKAIVTPYCRDGSGRIAYTHYTYQQFVEASQRLSSALYGHGIRPGTRILLFVKPSLDFSVLVFSLFRIGAVPVFIDPGVGRKNLLSTVLKTKPQVMIAEPAVHILRHFFPKVFSSVKMFITTKKASYWTSRLSLQKMLNEESTIESRDLEAVQGQDLAAIIYTSGGTGVPKGVLYTHEMFYQQVSIFKNLLPLAENEVDLSGFPLFSLFAIAMGMTSVIPWLDAAKPASADPFLLLKHILDNNVSLATGSPAIWEKLADYCLHKNIVLPSVHGVIMFGAPIALNLHHKLQAILPNGTTYTPYGATEGLPISWISGREILQSFGEKTLQGRGTCIGKEVPATKVKVIKSSFDVLPNFSKIEELPPYEVGELLVQGAQVTKEYFELPEETSKAKIVDGSLLWHRMGDLVYKDDKDYLWFCGRKVHQVVGKDQVYYPITCEAIFNQHPAVRRSALIGLNIGSEQQAAIVIERKDQKTTLSDEEKQVFREELMSYAKRFPHTQSIKYFFIYKTFPVDYRHNIKIDRLFLRDYFASRHAETL